MLSAVSEMTSVPDRVVAIVASAVETLTAETDAAGAYGTETEVIADTVMVIGNRPCPRFLE